MKKIILFVLTVLIITYSYLYFFHKDILVKYNLVSMSTEEAFTEIYNKNLWGEGSGPGSDPENSKPYLGLLQTYLNSPKFTSIVDLGCGDWRLMATLIVPSNKIYDGFDVVQSVIDKNSKTYTKPNIHFHHIHNIIDFNNQKGDLLIVKDVLQHWPNKDIEYFITNILPNFKYALITHDFDRKNCNIDIKHGEFKFIDLEIAPFNMRGLEHLMDYPSHGITKRVYLYTNPNLHEN